MLQGYLTKRAKCIQINFFIDYFSQHLDIAWNLIVPLIKLALPKEEGGSRTELQRKVALKLVALIIKRTTKCVDTGIFEKALGKYKKVSETVMEALNLKTWKKPVKYWQQYLVIFTSLTNTLTKNNVLNEMESVTQIKSKVESIIAEDPKAAGLKGKLKELEKILKA